MVICRKIEVVKQILNKSKNIRVLVSLRLSTYLLDLTYTKQQLWSPYMDNCLSKFHLSSQVSKNRRGETPVGEVGI